MTFENMSKKWIIKTAFDRDIKPHINDKFLVQSTEASTKTSVLKFKQILGIVLLLITIYLNANAQTILNGVTPA